MGTYSDKATPPHALVAAKRMASDPRAAPAYGEHVKFVVVHGNIQARLMDCVLPPEQFLESKGTLRLNDTYYITKQINPALDRIFSLMGVSVGAWFADLPRP